MAPEVDDEEEINDIDNDVQDADGESPSNVIQSQSNFSQDFWARDLGDFCDGGESDEDGSLAELFNLECRIDNNDNDEKEKEDNDNDNTAVTYELHARMQGAFYCKKDGVISTTPGSGIPFAIDQSVKKREESRIIKVHLSPVAIRIYFSPRAESLKRPKWLRLHGLTRQPRLGGDVLFFFQLLLPFHMEKHDNKVVVSDRKKTFYCENAEHSGVGHCTVPHIKLSDVVHLNGIIFACGQVKAIKAKLKLNCNWEAKFEKQLCMTQNTMNMFNFAHNFNDIYETLIHNVSYLSLNADSDPCLVMGLGALWEGLGMIGTVARNKLPKGTESHFLHKDNTSQSNKKYAKEVPASDGNNACCQVHCSFQTTGSYNIGSVNNLERNCFFMKERERGREEHKRQWGIEMNHARELFYFKGLFLIQVLEVLSLPRQSCQDLDNCNNFGLYKECIYGTYGPIFKS
eukprot:jgi/Psemu1/12350/gm1.12350_g